MPTLSFYRLVFILELYVAEFLFILPLKKKRLFYLRFLLCFLVSEGSTFALPLIINEFFNAFAFLIYFALTIPLLKFCCDEPWVSIVFCAVAGYTTQHLSYGIANLVITAVSAGTSSILGMYGGGTIDLAHLGKDTLFMVLLYLLSYFCCYVFAYGIFGRRLNHSGAFKIRSLQLFTIISCMLVVDIFINAMVTYLKVNAELIPLCVTTLYESICCIFLLYVQFGLVERGVLEREFDLSQYLLREKERQYALSQESIDLINLKCHDLKHQLRENGDRLTAGTAEEIEHALAIYDATVRTENETLDIILTEKSLKCAEEHILMTCMADGHAIDFMDDRDIYALFGNALDNSIEAVEKLSEGPRTIKVSVRRVGNMVTVSVRNPFAGKLKLGLDGLPRTSKATDGFHSFGMRSIREIAERYGGTMTFRAEGGLFALNVLLKSNQ